MKYETNHFESMDVASEWIYSVENERGSFRDDVFYPELVNFLKDMHVDHVVENLLDIGCGQGIGSKFVNPDEQSDVLFRYTGIYPRTTLAGEFKYNGIDGSSHLIDRAKKKYSKNGEFMVASAYNLPFENNYFDKVFSINLLMHLEKPEAALREMSRVMKPDGKFMIITASPSRRSYEQWHGMFINPTVAGNMIDGKTYVPETILPRCSIYTHSRDRLTAALINAFNEDHEKNTFRMRNQYTFSIRPLRNPKNTYIKEFDNSVSLFCIIKGHKRIDQE